MCIVEVLGGYFWEFYIYIFDITMLHLFQMVAHRDPNYVVCLLLTGIIL